jgi:hypothetical protein
VRVHFSLELCEIDWVSEVEILESRPTFHAMGGSVIKPRFATFVPYERIDVRQRVGSSQRLRHGNRPSLLLVMCPLVTGSGSRGHRENQTACEHHLLRFLVSC